MPDQLRSFEDLFLFQLRDLFSAETQLRAARPGMAARAQDPRLRQSLEKHAQETQTQLGRLTQIGRLLGQDLNGRSCPAMRDLIAAGQEALADDAHPDVQDAALIATAQRIEHYEIAGYGTAAHYAERLNHPEVAALLRQTL